MRIRSGLYGVALATAVAATFGNFAIAETIRLAHHHAVDGMLDKTAHVIAQEIKKSTNGELVIEIFPAAQLGQQQEAYDQLDLGIIDMTLTPSGLIDKKWAGIRHADLPFIWESFEHFQRAKSGEWGEAMVDGILANSNTRVIGWGGFGFRDMIFRGEPVTTVAGLNGMKMRAPESRLWIRMFELLDARPTPVTWGEVYTAMQTGVAAGLESPAVAALDMKFNEVTKSLVKTQHMFGILAICINDNRFKGLKPEFQKAILDAGIAAGAFFDTETKVQIESAYADMETKGMTVVEPADPAEWVTAMNPLWEEVKGDHADIGKMIDLAIKAK